MIKMILKRAAATAVTAVCIGLVLSLAFGRALAMGRTEPAAFNPTLFALVPLAGGTGDGLAVGLMFGALAVPLPPRPPAARRRAMSANRPFGYCFRYPRYSSGSLLSLIAFQYSNSNTDESTGAGGGAFTVTSTVLSLVLIRMKMKSPLSCPEFCRRA